MEDYIYEEKLSSKRTTILFITLAFSFLLLFLLRMMAAGFGWLAVVFFMLFCLFTFYVFNYRTLVIQLTPGVLRLTFGIIRWTMPIDTVEGCYLDEISMWRIGGAGIHFTSICKRYRAYFNFLEYPRVVVKLKKKRSPVWDIIFSTKDPERVIFLIQKTQ